MGVKLLALDTSTEACSAALWLDGEVVERHALIPSDHGRHVLSMANGLLEEAGLSLKALDALAFGRGPGSFTGVRIATGVIQGLALGLDLPVIPVSTLAALARGAYREHGRTSLLTAIDARMNEVYWGCYRIRGEGDAVLEGEEAVSSPRSVTVPEGGGWWGVGSGWPAYGEFLCERLGARLEGYSGEHYPHAVDIAALAVPALRAGNSVAVDDIAPVYLRDQVVRTTPRD